MRTLAVNGDIDIYRTDDGNLAIASDLDAVRMSCEEAIRAVRGEMLYAADQGMPLFETAFLRPRLAQFEAAARVALRAVPNVTNIDQFEATASDDTLRYTARIRSLFGPFELAAADVL